MFGMLDYRAHKLYWLLTLPLRIISRLLFFVIVAIAIAIGVWTGYSPWVQILIAYAAMEGMGLVFSLLWLGLVAWPIEKMFFWIIDVVPARGADEEEAKEIVRRGRLVWLTKKLETNIDSWTYQDTDDFVSLMNWRARLFFNEREQFEKRLAVLEQVYHDTGKQPGSLPKVEQEKLLKPYKPSWFQFVVVNYFNSLVGAAIIIAAILYLSPH
jgi:hypothetical protein